MAYLAWYDVLIAAVVPLLLIWVISGHAWNTGVLVNVTDSYFTLRNLFGREVEVKWSEVTPRVREWRESLRRLEFRTRAGLFGWPSRIVLLRGRAAEPDFKRIVHQRFTVTQSPLETRVGRAG